MTEEEVVRYEKRLVTRRKLRNDINTRAGDLHGQDTGIGNCERRFLPAVGVFNSYYIPAAGYSFLSILGAAVAEKLQPVSQPSLMYGDLYFGSCVNYNITANRKILA